MCQKIGIDIFSGVGGLSLGAENAGIKIAMAIEKDPIAVKTYIKIILMPMLSVKIFVKLIH